MGKLQNALDDLWRLSTSIAVVNYTSTTTFLLYFLSFDTEVTEKEKAGIVTIILTLSAVLAYSYRQVQKKFKICKSIFEENENKDYPNIDSSSNCKTEVEEINTFQSLKKLSRLFEKSYVRRFSLPIQSQGEFCYHCNRPAYSENEFAFENKLLLKTDPKISPSTNSNGICFEDSDDIPVLLHNCVKDLGDIIERVKFLNDVYTETDEGIEITKPNSTTTFQKINSDGEFVEKEEHKKSKRQSVSDTQKVTDSSRIVFSFQPYLSQYLDISRNPTQKGKIDLSSQLPESFGVYKSLSENIRSYNRNFSEEYILEPISKSCIINTEPLLLKIPSHFSGFHSSANDESDRNMGKETISLQFYETKSPGTQTATPKVSLKNPLPRIPMKPHMLSIPARQYVQANTRERHVAVMPKKEATISKHSLKIFKMSMTSKNLPVILRNAPIILRNAPAISRKASKISRKKRKMKKPQKISTNASMMSKNGTNKDLISENLPLFSVKVPISVDEILISMKNNFIADMNDHLISMNDFLISKFELLDILNFADIFYYFVDFYGLYPDHNINDDNQQYEYSFEDF